MGHLLHSYDRNKYESMARVVDVYNTAVREQLVNKLYISTLGERATRGRGRKGEGGREAGTAA